jgi:hypothetical protein
MPFKSKAQRRKFAQLLVEGKIKPEAYERWNVETGKAKLPERVRPKAKSRAKRKVKSKRAKRTKAKSGKSAAAGKRRS